MVVVMGIMMKRCITCHPSSPLCCCACACALVRACVCVPAEKNKLTACGTPAWTAPEIVKMERYTEKVDVYR